MFNKCTRTRHMAKSKDSKHTSLGAVLEVEMFKKCMLVWREAHSPIGFLFWKFRHRLVRYYWYGMIQFLRSRITAEPRILFCKGMRCQLSFSGAKDVVQEPHIEAPSAEFCAPWCGVFGICSHRVAFVLSIGCRLPQQWETDNSDWKFSKENSTFRSFFWVDWWLVDSAQYFRGWLIFQKTPRISNFQGFVNSFLSWNMATAGIMSAGFVGVTPFVSFEKIRCRTSFVQW